jgi:hypothetical protein
VLALAATLPDALLVRLGADGLLAETLEVPDRLCMRVTEGVKDRVAVTLPDGDRLEPSEGDTVLVPVTEGVTDAEVDSDAWGEAAGVSELDPLSDWDLEAMDEGAAVPEGEPEAVSDVLGVLDTLAPVDTEAEALGGADTDAEAEPLALRDAVALVEASPVGAGVWDTVVLCVVLAVHDADVEMLDVTETLAPVEMDAVALGVPEAVIEGVTDTEAEKLERWEVLAVELGNAEDDWLADPDELSVGDAEAVLFTVPLPGVGAGDTDVVVVDDAVAPGDVDVLAVSDGDADSVVLPPPLPGVGAGVLDVDPVLEDDGVLVTVEVDDTEPETLAPREDEGLGDALVLCDNEGATEDVALRDRDAVSVGETDAVLLSVPLAGLGAGDAEVEALGETLAVDVRDADGVADNDTLAAAEGLTEGSHLG